MLGLGPKSTQIMNVKGLDTSPIPSKYKLPSTLSKMQKSFGISFQNYYKVVVPKDKTADKAVPGPGKYHENILE